MKRTSFRTLVLLAELFAVVAAYQFISWTPSATAALVWLDDDPNEVTDPNAVEDPNTVNDPQPESVGAVSWVRLDDEPTDPNAPDEQQEPLPEATRGLPAI
jgi:hypothetical protein